MPDQRLVDYVRDSLQRGMPENELVGILLDQGWNINDINEAINIVQGYSQVSPSPPLQTTQNQQQPAAMAAQPAQSSARPRRPLAVSIICVLGFIGSALLLVGGLSYIVLGQFLTAMIPGSDSLPFFGNQTGVNAGGILSSVGLTSGYLGILFIIMAIVGFAGFFLLWKMKRTGWIIITLLGFMAIIFALMGYNAANILSLVIEVVLMGAVIGYLFIKRRNFT